MHSPTSTLQRYISLNERKELRKVYVHAHQFSHKQIEKVHTSDCLMIRDMEGHGKKFSNNGKSQPYSM